jgi:signal transduction histidine kinase
MFRTRKGYVVALQWLLVTVVGVWGGVSGAWRTSPAVFWSLIGLSALGNAALMRMPLPYFYQPNHWMHLFVADTMFVGAAIYAMAGFDTDLYLPYFLILLAAALTRSLARAVLVAFGVSVVYLVLVWRAGGGEGFLDAAYLIRLPFFIVIAVFTSYLAHGARLQEEAVAATRALSEQVLSLQQLAAGIAHEVRNPLTAISNTLQALLARIPAGGRDRALVEEALGQVTRVTRIVQETLELARPARLSPVWLDLAALAERVVREAEPAIRETGGRVVRRPGAGPVGVWADGIALEQALSNVVRNAVEAMPAAGELSVEAFTEIAEGRELVGVRVSDTGPGIPAHQLVRLFQPFYTTKAQGTGLGLCLARKCLQAHGGDLAVETEAGRGTRVTLRLPVRGGAAAGAPPEGGHVEALAGR